jgi:hypothetical protein
MAKKDLRTLSVTADPKMIDVVIEHVANGGSAIELCKTWQVRFSEIMRAIRANPESKSRYEQALIDRDEWAKERILTEIRSLGTYNIKDALNADGTFKPLKDMPDEIVAAIKEFDKDGAVKFHDKTKALDMYGKKLSLFVERKEITGKLTLADLITEATGDKSDE